MTPVGAVVPDDGILAIDVGGTKLAAAWVDRDGEVHDRRQVPTEPSGPGAGEELWTTLVGLLDAVCAGRSPAAVGVGCGGPMQWPAGLVSPLNLPAWRSFPLRSRLSERYPGRVVRLVNDAIAMAVGEHWRGAGRDAHGLLGIVVSTGVGGGLVLDGRIVAGPTGNAGHIGHVVVDPSGPACACGGLGCLEAIARGPAVVQWALDQGWKPTGVADGSALLDAARAGAEVAVAAFARAGEALGVAIASAAHLLELDVVAVGGGLTAAGDLLLGPARSAFARHARMDFVRDCRIVPAALGNDAGLVGAAALVAAGDRYWPAGAD
ncbi:MAG TPA: ROK family protein [Mycobacteriales bacterium]|nr:ROK family protein [Mycobacteriales bacterium]